MSSPDRHPHCRSRGSVLILALWSLFFLGALALAVGAHVSASLRMAGATSKARQANAAIDGAVELAMMVLVRNTNGWDSLDEPWRKSRDFNNIRIGNVFCTLGFTDRLDNGRAVTNYGMRDAESQISINTADDRLLRQLFEVCGDVDAKSAGEMAAAVQDWRDEDSNELTDGAENSYYTGLPRPYPCHDGSFEIPEELLLVRGVTEEVYERLAPHFTVFGSGRVNMNTASPTVLRCVAGAVNVGKPGDRAALVERILAFRNAGNVFEGADARTILSELNDYEALTGNESAVLRAMLQANGYLATRSTCFVGDVSARVGWPCAVRDKNGDRRVVFVYDTELNERLYWHEQ